MHTIKTRRTSISDLPSLGDELPAEHLRLAAGGLPLGGGLRFPTNGCVPTYRKGEMDHPSDDFTITI